jgi:hypothetical protein
MQFVKVRRHRSVEQPPMKCRLQMNDAEIRYFRASLTNSQKKGGSRYYSRFIINMSPLYKDTKIVALLSNSSFCSLMKTNDYLQ